MKTNCDHLGFFLVSRMGLPIICTPAEIGLPNWYFSAISFKHDFHILLHCNFFSLATLATLVAHLRSNTGTIKQWPPVQWPKNMLWYLSLDIICSEERAVLWEQSLKENCELQSPDAFRLIVHKQKYLMDYNSW